MSSGLGIGRVIRNKPQALLSGRSTFREMKKERAKSERRRTAVFEKQAAEAEKARAEEEEKRKIADESVRQQKEKARRRTIFAGQNMEESIFRKVLGS